MTFDIEQAKRDGKAAGLPEGWLACRHICTEDNVHHIPPVKADNIGILPMLSADGRWVHASECNLRNLPPKTRRRWRVPVRKGRPGERGMALPFYAASFPTGGYYEGELSDEDLQRLRLNHIPVKQLPDEPDTDKITEAKAEGVRLAVKYIENDFPRVAELTRKFFHKELESEGA